MKNILIIVLILSSFTSFCQSKKEQIEILANKADSLNRVLNSTRNANSKKEIEYKEQISTLQKQLEDLNNSLTKAKEALLKKEVEINTSNQELKNKLLEITVLKNQINEKDAQIANLKLELNNLKTSLNNIQNNEIAKKTESFQSVTIGTQIWMTENLNVAAFRNGDLIKETKTPEEWKKAGDNKQPAWCYYDNDQKNEKKFGKLYNWYAVNDPRGLVPEGWHIPTDKEFEKLTNFIGGKGSKMKSSIGWVSSSNGDNTSGFNALPGGLIELEGYFDYIGSHCNFWSSSEQDSRFAKSINLSLDDVVNKSQMIKSLGFSVRCIKD
jgi:uncharacterized protein (TIGR02145 family)